MTQPFTEFSYRIFRVLTLDRKVFIEIYADPRATLQSFLLVLLVTIIVEIGYSGFEGLQGFRVIKLLIKLLLLGGVIWTIEAAIGFIVGRFVLPMPGTGLTPPSVARAVTFAQAPWLLMIFGLIPGVSMVLWIALAVLEYVTTTAAVRHAFGWSMKRASAGGFLIVTLYSLIAAGFEFFIL